MKTIYLTIASLLVIGSTSAQNLLKSEGQTQETQAYGAHHVGNPTIATRGINAVLNETFEGAVPPTGWGASVWLSSSTSTLNETKATGHTAHFAFFDAYNENPGVEGSLVTPILQPVAANNTLSYSVNYYNISTNPAFQGAGAELYIEFSTNNGTTWTTSTTNVLASLTNYNTATNTGWITNNVSLAAYNGMDVMVRFRAVSDYGWSNIGIDNVTGPNVKSLVNDISATPGTMVQIDGFDYFQVIPNSQLVSAAFGVIANNNGSAAQTNVTLHANTNSGAYTSATGLSNPIASLASGSFDTLWTSIAPTATVPTMFETGLNLTQTETDEIPTNNMGDSVTFYSSDYSFYRTVNVGAILSPYSFGAASAASGMEYGATYIIPNLDRVDSITTIIYKNVGAGNVVGKLYTINPSTGVFVNVASTAPYTPPVGVNSTFATKTLALTVPFVAPAGTLLAATIQINGTIPGDTTYVGSDNAFMGDPSVAGVVYYKSGATFVWGSIIGQVPVVGIELQNSSVGIDKNKAADLISVYPNPSTGMFTVNLGTSSKSVVEVYNVVGEMVYSNQFNSQSASIDLNALSAGVYSVKVTSNNSVSVKKVMIAK